MGSLRVLDKKLGDLKINWNPDSPEETAAAKKQFEDLVGKTTTVGTKKMKYAAYDVKKDGGKGGKITQFDKNAGLIIIAPEVERG